MTPRRYTVALKNSDLLAFLGKSEWSVTLTASNTASAWRKFIAQRKAPVLQFGRLQPLASDYVISFARR